MASLSTVSDIELLISMKAGNKSAYNEIYERYWRHLYQETFKCLKNSQIVEEIVQDVFIDLWVKRERKQIEHLRKYLIAAARYTLYLNYRKIKSLPYFEEPFENMAISNMEADSLLILEELKSAISFWSNMQPEKRAEIFRLKHIEDLSTKQISKTLGVTQKTVQNQLITSFKSLREFLKHIEPLSMLT